MTDDGSRQPGTLSRLFARHRRRMVRFARGLVGRANADDADDCVQDASAEFLRKPRDYHSESHFVRLFRLFVRNASSRKRKHARAAKRGGDDQPAPLPTDLGLAAEAHVTGPPTAAMRGELHAALLAHLDGLKPDYRRVIELRLMRELGWRDVAAEMDLGTQDAARKKYAHAITQLRARAGELDSRFTAFPHGSELDEHG